MTTPKDWDGLVEFRARQLWDFEYRDHETADAWEDLPERTKGPFRTDAEWHIKKERAVGIIRVPAEATNGMFNAAALFDHRELNLKKRINAAIAATLFQPEEKK